MTNEQLTIENKRRYAELVVARKECFAKLRAAGTPPKDAWARALAENPWVPNQQVTP